MLPNWLYGKSRRKLQEIFNSGGQAAADISYSNTESSLEATNVQDAIDEVAESINNLSSSYVIKSLNQNVSVTADGVKTFKELIGDLASAYLNALQSMAKGELAEAVGVRLNESIGWAFCTSEYKYAARNAASVSLNFLSANASATSSAEIKSATVHTTEGSRYLGKYNIVTQTFTDYLSTVPASGTTLSLKYNIYRQVF